MIWRKIDWRRAFNWRSVPLRALLFAAGFTILISSASTGSEREKPKLIEEFLTTEPSYVEPKGEVQVSSAFDYRRPAEDWRIPLSIQFGITDRVEAEVDAIYLSIPGDGSTNRGPGDMDPGLHYALRPDVEKVSLTVGVDVGLPTGNKAKDLGSGQVDVELFGITGMKVCQGELHVTGVLDVGDKVEPGLDIGLAYPLGGLRLTLETNVVVDPERPGELAVSQDKGENVWVIVTPGLFHRASPEIEYGIGVPIGLTRSSPDWGLIGRLTIEFEL